MPENELEIMEERPLSKREIHRLEGLEEVIAINFKGFVAVGKALAEIREERLYREKFKTFEEYCRNLWDMSRPRAYQLIESAQVIDNLSTIVDKNDDILATIVAKNDDDNDDPYAVLPINEAQARELARLEPEEQRRVWRDLIDRTFIQMNDKGRRAKITSLSVKKAVLEFKGEKLDVKIDQTTKEVKENRTDFASDAFNEALDIFFNQVKVEKAKKWKYTSRQAAFRCIQGLLEVVGQAGPKELEEMCCAMELADREKLKRGGFRIFRMAVKELVIDEWYRGEEWVLAGQFESPKALSDGFKELLADPLHLRG
ncbi:MAG: hypothetical protein Q7W05_12975 [Deltaproteobacteria bacterium]|nr:hypothetical protein [Deltaproteobacteria bacterium]